MSTMRRKKTSLREEHEVDWKEWTAVFRKTDFFVSKNLPNFGGAKKASPSKDKLHEDGNPAHLSIPSM